MLSYPKKSRIGQFLENFENFELKITVSSSLNFMKFHKNFGHVYYVRIIDRFELVSLAPNSLLFRRKDGVLRSHKAHMFMIPRS